MELQCIAKEIKSLEIKLSGFITSEIKLATEVASYLIDSGGKRIRPILCILTGKALGYEKDDLITLACAIELLHTASLIHDDVVDNSEIRRGKKSIHKKWDNAHSVLVGDFVYSKAFQLMALIGNKEVITSLSNSTNRISEGEILQLTMVEKEINQKEYFEIIGRKTAELFQASVKCAALLSEASDNQLKSISQFGFSLGIAFQLKDDLLDYFGHQSETGKKLGKDFEEGKLTLPLIKTLELSSEKDANFIRTSLKEKKIENFEEVRSIMENSGATEEIKNEINKYSLSCLSGLKILSTSPYQETLKEIVIDLDKRKV